MKKILGLDLGTNSIGWAVVNEAENETEQSSIIKIGVRVNPLTTDELGNFEKGKSITTNSDRTLKRSARRNLQRYKLRKEALIKILKNNNFISDDTILSEQGNKTTFETYSLRAKAVEEEITLTEFARVLLMLNKKRGYKSSRKVKSTDEGQLIDGMSVARELYDRDLTPGQFLLEQIYKGVKTEPDFYRSDLQSEFDKIWEFQKQYYSELFTDELKEQLKGKNKGQTWTICQKAFNIEGESRTTKGVEQKIENYQWRADSLKEQMTLEQLTIVFQEINNQLNKSSNYLGNISDRSKELYFNHQTVGQYLYSKLSQDSHYSTKNKVFYRQDYLDEFESLWESQKKYHKELTDELKKEIRDVVIFYQRPLKSQKGLLSICELEGREIEIEKNGKKITKIIGPRVAPKSSPIFQESKIWQILNNVQIEGNVIPNVQQDLFGEATEFKYGKRPLTQEEKQTLFAELNIKEKLTESQALQILEMKGNYKLNYKEIEGNKTRASFFKAFQEIIELSGHEIEFTKKKAHKIEEELKEIFVALGFSTEILGFKTDLTKEEIKDQQIEKQAYYKLWHLLYSFEGDSSKLGNEKLIQKVMELCEMPKEYATILSNITFPLDYSSLSTRATLKILPFLKQGLMYSDACEKAGYKHSKKSLTKEEIENKILRDSLSQLPKNSLRNPVVEKILNQMVNVVNSIIKEYGKLDEIRIELARELKKSAKERDELTKAVNSSKKDHEKIVSILQSSFNIQNPSRNDIIRYKLYEELKPNGYHTLYTNTYIPQEKLFSKEFDIEHIIPQALLFDDSFSNKTLEKRDANIEKGRMTAYDYVLEKRGEQGIEEYKSKIDNLNISSSKRKKLLMRENDIPDGFIDRDLRNSQYISKKSREILEQIVKVVNTTTGSVTDRLREDWQLVDVMKELNWNKYDKCGQTESYTNRDGNVIKKIKDWTKRNDHRHHAMDALTIAFTKPSYIQYLNNLNARVEKSVEEYLDLDNVEIRLLDKDKRSSAVYGIETKELYRDKNGKLRFNPPMPLDELRKEAKKHLEDTLVSIKAKNKVVTRNTNIIKTKNGEKQIIQQTPRGQLHLETIYGRIKQYETKEETVVNASFDIEKIQTVANKEYRDALLKRLQEFNNDPKKAFTGKNTLEKNPIWLNKLHTDQVPTKVKIVNFVNVYTIRKPIDKDLKIDKVVDVKIRKILEARLEEYGGKANDAFSNLDENPIWLNKEKGIAIKRVTITGISNATALRSKRDKEGNFILNEDGTKQAVDFVNTGNNHHVAIYRKPVLDKKTGQQQFDDNGNAKFELEEKVVSFFEATIRANNGEPIIDKTYNQDKGWQFLFSMKQNEYFVFPRYETTKDVNGNEVTIKTFDPKDIDLLNPDNYSLISPNLFRVQKISTKNYMFRHHLETVVGEIKQLRDIVWKLIQTPNNLDGIIKVRVNHIGQIVEVGEY